MFADDHRPPHFHVWTPDGEVSVAIDGLSIMAGDIDRRDLQEALEWASQNLELLQQYWVKLNDRK